MPAPRVYNKHHGEFPLVRSTSAAARNTATGSSSASTAIGMAQEDGNEQDLRGGRCVKC